MQVPLSVVVSLGVALVGGAIGSTQLFELKGDAEAREAELEAQITAGDIDSQLRAIEAELKLLRSIEERRQLTPDEADRRDFLRELRKMLQEQRLEGGGAGEA